MIKKSRKRAPVMGCLWYTLFLLSTAFPLCGGENSLSHSLRAEVLVANPEKAAEHLAKWAEERGGYFLLKTADRVTIRFPSSEVGALRKELERIAEAVVSVELEARDLREETAATRSKLKSLEAILKQNLIFLDKADVKGTLAIEQEILRLVKEIEGFKGKLRKLEADRLFARGEISLRVKRRSIPGNTPSSFEWINSVDFYRFMEGMTE